MPLRLLVGMGVCMLSILVLLQSSTRWFAEPPVDSASNIVHKQDHAAGSIRTVHPQQTRYWQDPSIDPEVLKRAYAPPSLHLLPKDRPSDANIYPDAKALKAMGLDPRSISDAN